MNHLSLNPKNLITELLDDTQYLINHSAISVIEAKLQFSRN